MSNPIILNAAEGGIIAVTWAKHPGAKGEDCRFGDDDAPTPGNQNNDGSNRTRKVIAGVKGKVTSVGGVFGEVVIKIDDDPLGRSVRFAENAKIHVTVGRQVYWFDVVAEDALFRKDAYFPNGAYRDLHTNGFDAKGNRIQYSAMITHSQAAGKAILYPVLAPNQRKVAVIAKRRSEPTTEGTNYIVAENLLPGALPFADGYVSSLLPGGTVGGSNVWLKIGDKYSHISVFESQSLVGLTDLGTIEPKPVTHVVSFETRIDGSVPTDYNVINGSIINPPVPNWYGHTFLGWYDSEGNFTVPFDFTQPITASHKIVGLWEEIVVEPPVVVPDPEPEPEPEPEKPVDPKPTLPKPAIGGIIGAVLLVLGLAWAAITGLFN